MTKEQNEFNSKIKPYHIILLACLLSTVMILNSNYVNNYKAEAKMNQEKAKLFHKIVYGRMLQENSNSNTEKVCSLASDDLKEYYQTGDLSKIDLDDDSIECKDKDKDYMQALIDLVKQYLGDEDDGSDPGTLRNLEGEIDTDKIVEYGMRIIAMVIFLVISILSIFGWIICCICTCCDCCCCCCCKKINCKTPCFIFTYIFYALAVGVCIYGLTQATKIFTGLANTECSILKFFDEVLYGETKQELPRWAGISGIKQLLFNIRDEITTMGQGSYEDLEDKMEEIPPFKNAFVNLMHTSGDNFYDSNGEIISSYKKDFRSEGTTEYKLEDTYYLSLVKVFGRYDKDSEEDRDDYKYTKNSFLSLWNREYITIADNADYYMGIAKDGFKDILEDNLGNVRDALTEGSEKLDKLTKPFEDANSQIGTILSDYSELIDKYGKMGVNIVFSVLMVMNIALAVLMLLICLFSMRSTAGCCCCRCLFKFCTHVLWNVLALMMILSLFIGSIIALVGRVGGDIMSLVSFIMSEENFNSQNPLLLGQLGDAKNYIKICIHGDGNIAEDLNLGNSLDSFEDINEVEESINNVLANFSQVVQNCFIYNLIKDKLKDGEDYKINIEMIPMNGYDVDKQQLSYEKVLEKLNAKAPGDDNWSLENAEESPSCDVSLPQGSSYHPSKCNPNDKVSTYNDVDFEKYASILNDINDVMKYANSEDSDKPNSMKNIIKDLHEKYSSYLNKYIEVLDVFKDTIHRITGLIRDYIGDGQAFSFINGRFIGTNLKIILKYLKYSLGEDFYNVGVCLILVGCSLIFSISSTILLLVIINIQLKENMKPSQTIISPYKPAPGTLETPAAVVSPNY